MLQRNAFSVNLKHEQKLYFFTANSKILIQCIFMVTDVTLPSDRLHMLTMWHKKDSDQKYFLWNEDLFDTQFY